MFIGLLISLLSCGNQKLIYQCTCIQVAYGAGENGENIDNSFSEDICDTTDNIQEAFDINGSIYSALEECRAELSEEASDGYECECDCVYQAEC